jgi:hypothetical protein
MEREGGGAVACTGGAGGVSPAGGGNGSKRSARQSKRQKKGLEVPASPQQQHQEDEGVEKGVGTAGEDGIECGGQAAAAAAGGEDGGRGGVKAGGGSVNEVDVGGSGGGGGGLAGDDGLGFGSVQRRPRLVQRKRRHSYLSFVDEVRLGIGARGLGTRWGWELVQGA